MFDVASLKKQLESKTRRLQKLKEREAYRGIDTAPDDLMEIEDLEKEIEQLQKDLEARQKPKARQDKTNSSLSTHNDSSLSNISSKSSSNPTEFIRPTQQITIYMSGDFSSLTSDRRSAAVDAFAAVMGITSQEVEVYNVYPGSIVFELGVPSHAAQHFRSSLERNNTRLHSLEIEKVVFQWGSDQTEEWAVKEGNFHLIAPAQPAASSRSHENFQGNIQTVTAPRHSLLKTISWNWNKVGAIAGVLAVIIAILAFAISEDFRTLVASSNYTKSDLIVEVVDNATGQPISGVEIQIRVEESDDISSAITDGAGIARFSNVIANEKTDLKISALGDIYGKYEKYLTVDKVNPFIDLRLTPVKTSTCSSQQKYEPNNSRSQACPIQSGQSIFAYPDDKEDIYYFDLDKPSRVGVRIRDYTTAYRNREDFGQLLVYDDHFETKSLAAVRYLQDTGELDNELGILMPGRYYIRVHTPTGFNLKHQYRLTIGIMPTF